MREFRSLIGAIVLLLVVGAVSTLHAQDGLDDAFLRLNSACDFSARFAGPAIATADFNHDTHPDGAVLLRDNNTFQIEVDFRFQRVGRITFASSFPRLLISALDVNHDGSPDLVIEEPFSRHRLFVWLNDGYGAFHSVGVEEYPTSSDDSYRSLAYPFEGRQTQSLVIPAKSRIRITPSDVSQAPLSADVVRCPRQLTTGLLQFICAPNLVRGPPSGVLL